MRLKTKVQFLVLIGWIGIFSLNGWAGDRKKAPRLESPEPRNISEPFGSERNIDSETEVPNDVTIISDDIKEAIKAKEQIEKKIVELNDRIQGGNLSAQDRDNLKRELDTATLSKQVMSDYFNERFDDRRVAGGLAK
jgi:hypothetical protein